MIEKKKNKWVLYSRDGSKVLGEFDTEEQAIERERQINYFKHQVDESLREGGEGSGNFGHEGRPGEVGGSSTSGSSLNLDKKTAARVDDSRFLSDVSPAEKSYMKILAKRFAGSSDGDNFSGLVGSLERNNVKKAFDHYKKISPQRREEYLKPKESPYGTGTVIGSYFTKKMKDDVTAKEAQTMTTTNIKDFTSLKAAWAAKLKERAATVKDKLVEAGRTVSKANEERLRKALEALHEILNNAGLGMTPDAEKQVADAEALLKIVDIKGMEWPEGKEPGWPDGKNPWENEAPLTPAGAVMQHRATVNALAAMQASDRGEMSEGGFGSGNWGHSGRPGQVGGSGDGGDAAISSGAYNPKSDHFKSDIHTMTKNISDVRKRAASWKKEGDREMERSTEGDAKQLDKFLSHVKSGNTGKAWKVYYNMDTAVKDEIPSRLLKWVANSEGGKAAMDDSARSDDSNMKEGGPGSGNFGHSGRPGEVGGSSGGGSYVGSGPGGVNVDTSKNWVKIDHDSARATLDHISNGDLNKARKSFEKMTAYGRAFIPQEYKDVLTGKTDLSTRGVLISPESKGILKGLSKGNPFHDSSKYGKIENEDRMKATISNARRELTAAEKRHNERKESTTPDNVNIKEEAVMKEANNSVANPAPDLNGDGSTRAQRKGKLEYKDNGDGTWDLVYNGEVLDTYDSESRCKRAGDHFIAAGQADSAKPPATTIQETEIVGDLVELREAEIAEAAKDGQMYVRIIQPGWGSSGYYSPKLLENAAAKYKAGTQMFIDHPGAREEKERPERSLRDLAGVLVEDGQWRGDGIYAKVQTLNGYGPMIKQLAPYIGTSHRANGKMTIGEAEGKKGKIIESIDHVNSVDFVTKPGAGGKVISLLEAFRVNKNEGKGWNASDHTLAVESDAAKVEDRGQVKTLTEKEEEIVMQEEIKKLREDNARLSGMLVERESRDIRNEMLAGVKDKLPAVSLARVHALAEASVEADKFDAKTYRAVITEAIRLESSYVDQIRTQLKEAGKKVEVEIEDEGEEEEKAENEDTPDEAPTMPEKGKKGKFVKGMGNATKESASPEASRATLRESLVKMNMAKGHPKERAEKMADIFLNGK